MNDHQRRLIGQSLMLSFDGPDATPVVLDALERTCACGVILFAPNITTPDALHRLTSTLQAHARSLDLPPLLIAIDQEGGTVSRLPAPFVTVPSQMAQAATGDPEAAALCASITGQQLRAFGINTNFAPTLDANNNPANPVIGIRAYSSDPALVSHYGVAALQGYAEAGVMATAKHFPGHGDTDIDSHVGLPTVRHARARLDAVELAPFRAAIAAGVPAIMTAHIVFPDLDDLPATLSRPILTGLLRDELGFDGLIFTDALMMRAIADTYGLNQASIMSKAAGADVLLPLGQLDSQIAVVDALAAALHDGRLDETMFEATAQRLERMRELFGLTHDVPPFTLPDAQLAAEALDVARRSITLVHDRGVLPLLPPTRLGLIDCVLPRFSDVEEVLEPADFLHDLLLESFPQATRLLVGPTPSDDEIAQATAFARGCDAVLLVTRNASMIPAQARLVQTLVQGNVPLVHVAARPPYDAQLAPGAATTLLCYGDPAVSLQALVDVLAGRAEAGGTSPVPLTF